MEEKSYMINRDELGQRTGNNGEELEALVDFEAMELSKLLQLQDLLLEMKMEVMVSEYKEEPVLRIWPTAGDVELDCYLKYNMWDIDKGIFFLEAIVPVAPCPKEEKEILDLCMKYNKDSLVGKAYPEDGLLYLRMVYREYKTPIDKEDFQNFLKDLAEEWEYLESQIK